MHLQLVATACSDGWVVSWRATSYQAGNQPGHSAQLTLKCQLFAGAVLHDDNTATQSSV